jgi:LPS export ABC transporter protein LptC
MRPGRGSWLIILLIAAIASSVIFMLAPDRQPPPQTRLRSEQGYYVRDGTLTGTGADGQILYRITTRAARQNLDDGTISMQEVAVSYAPAAEIPWDMRATRGQVLPDGNIIQLSGDVLRPVAADDPDGLPGARSRNVYRHHQPARGDRAFTGYASRQGDACLSQTGSPAT